MPLRIRTPSSILLLRALCILSAILFGVQICSCDVTWSKYDKTDNIRLTVIYDQMQLVTDITCCSECQSSIICKSVNYNPGSKDCQFSSINLTDSGSNSESSDEWAIFTKSESYPPQSGSPAQTTQPSQPIQPACPEPPVVAFSSVDQPNQVSFPGDRVSYTCNTGYATTSSPSKLTSTCDSGLTWSPLFFECKIECQAPPEAAYANFEPQSSVYVEGYTVTYGCINDYEPDVGPDKMTSECQANGEWSTLLFECLD